MEDGELLDLHLRALRLSITAAAQCLRSANLDAARRTSIDAGVGGLARLRADFAAVADALGRPDGRRDCEDASVERTPLTPLVPLGGPSTDVVLIDNFEAESVSPRPIAHPHPGKGLRKAPSNGRGNLAKVATKHGGFMQSGRDLQGGGQSGRDLRDGGQSGGAILQRVDTSRGVAAITRVHPEMLAPQAVIEKGKDEEVAAAAFAEGGVGDSGDVATALTAVEAKGAVVGPLPRTSQIMKWGETRATARAQLDGLAVARKAYAVEAASFKGRASAALENLPLAGRSSARDRVAELLVAVGRAAPGRVVDDALSRSGQRGDVRSSDLSKGELVQLAWSPPASSRLF